MFFSAAISISKPIQPDPFVAAPRISLSKIKNILAFASDDHAKAFLAFHGLQIVIDKETMMPWKGLETTGGYTKTFGAPLRNR